MATYEEVHNFYTYDRETGAIRHRGTGEDITKVKPKPYGDGKPGRYATINGRSYSVSKLAYLLVNKHNFKGRVRYVDGDPTNTRWENMEFVALQPPAPPPLKSVLAAGENTLAYKVAYELVTAHPDDPVAAGLALASDKSKPRWFRELVAWLVAPP